MEAYRSWQAVLRQQSNYRSYTRQRYPRLHVSGNGSQDTNNHSGNDDRGIGGLAVADAGQCGQMECRPFSSSSLWIQGLIDKKICPL
jgi:hypothetical protein